MTPSRRSGIIGLILGAALVAACSSTPSNPNAGRYSISQDRAPSQRVDPASIPEVVPKPLTRTQAGNRSPYTVLGKTYRVLPTEAGYRERGVASWYGEKFHGHKTSNGETFDMYQATAAHKTLPIPSFLRVTNLDNNRSIVVRVNDRGPFHGDRLIDLSYGAALKLGYADRGTARVQLEAIEAAGAVRDRSRARTETAPLEVLRRPGQSNRFLQVGAFAELDSARRLVTTLQGMTSRPVFIRSVHSPGRGLLHRVRVGPVDDAGEIRQLTERVVAADLGRPYTVAE